MVRAIIEGRKTQTRRIVKNPEDYGCQLPNSNVSCAPLGKAGDRLWVKETFLNNALAGYRAVYLYRADGDEKPADRKWKLSIFCTRAASRINLEIVSVRVERLQDISEQDAKAEGTRDFPEDASEQEFDRNLCPQCGGTGLYTALAGNLGTMPDTDCGKYDTYKKRYAILWNSINGPDSWNRNPFVWCYEFKKL